MMRRLDQERSVAKWRGLLLGVLLTFLLGACGTKSMSGGFLGTATAELYPRARYGEREITTSASDVLATVVQSGNEVTVRFANTTLLANCELDGRISRGIADIFDGQFCETEIDGIVRGINVTGGTIAVGDYGDADVMISVDGFTGVSRDESFILKFRGKVKK